MNFIRNIRKKLKYGQRTLEIEAIALQKCTDYDGKGDCSVILDTFTEKANKAHIVHFIITSKPFERLKAAVVMGSICSFSVKVTEKDYSLYRLWFDTKMDNWQTHLLTTEDCGELERRIAEEWNKGTDGTFFRK